MERRIYFFLKRYFSFSKREAKGFVWIMPCLMLLYFIPIAYSRLVPAQTLDIEGFLALANSTQMERAPEAEVHMPSDPLALKAFDPNTVSEEQLLSMGVQSAAAKNWVKYIEAGGRFRQVEDLDKVYGLSEENISSLAEWVVFDSAPIKERRPVAVQVAKKVSTPPLAQNIPFSEADSVLLQVVPGIGKVLAGRIIKFREALGGLQSREQLLEVYGLTAEVMERIFEHFTFEPQIHRKLNLNGATVSELAAHPYITYGQAKVIVAFREQHGDYETSDDLLRIKILDAGWLEKLKPYLLQE